MTIQHIAFTGSAEFLPALRSFVTEVASVKKSSPDWPIVEQRGPIIQDGKWVDLLPPCVIDRFVSGDTWDLEDILDCMLTGEYELAGVDFSDGKGQLHYNPLAYPFGGTDPLKALVEVFGFTVTGDSFHDGFADWQRKQKR